MMTREDLDRSLIGIVVILVGAFFTYTNISDAYQFYSDVRHYKQTTAVISDIVFIMSARHVYVQYEIEGVRYSERDIGYRSARMRVGDKIKIYYDPHEPGIIYGEGYGRSGLFYATLTIIISIGSLRLFYWYYYE